MLSRKDAKIVKREKTALFEHAETWSSEEQLRNKSNMIEYEVEKTLLFLRSSYFAPARVQRSAIASRRSSHPTKRTPREKAGRRSPASRSMVVITAESSISTRRRLCPDCVDGISAREQPATSTQTHPLQLHEGDI